MNSTRQDDLRKLVNSSGFPFQLGIENEIKKTVDTHGWKVLAREHPWQHPESGESGYVDLVLEEAYNVQVMVVECKRVRDSEWVFLIPEGGRPKRRDTRSWMTSLMPNKRKVGWYDMVLDPESPQAEFCVVRGQNKDRPMLERIGSELVEATESIALEELRPDGSNLESGTLRLYFPVLVTTAEIHVCRFSLDDIAVSNGELSKAQFERVPFVRFRKSLTTRLSKDAPPQNLKAAAKEKERTIFIVNANSFAELLKEWELPEGGPWIR